MQPTHRFSSRVEDYVRYRPRYPGALFDLLIETCGLTTNMAVADVGSGTGIFAEGLIARGIRVHGVEPNEPMRAAAEETFRNDPLFVSVAGTAEATGLPEDSVDLVTAAQAFHWFDRPRARHEFKRILRPPAWCAIIWNERLVDVDDFSKAYEQLLLDFGTDYTTVDHRNVSLSDLREFYGHADFIRNAFPNEQRLDLDGLKGRVRSSSYMPPPDHPRYESMMEALDQIFHRHQTNGEIAIRYETATYLGRVL